MLTGYSYDALDNLTSVTQGSQARTFTYDSLSRLRSATQPESGTTIYEYDNAGNLTARTDARGWRTSYGYDPLNRLTQKTYSHGTPAVTYSYDDQGTTYGIGRLKKVTNGISTSTILAYDALGRVYASQQSTGGKTYNLSKHRRKYWQGVIAEQEASGKSVRVFCRERDLGEHSFYAWRQRLREEKPVAFALVEAKPCHGQRSSNSRWAAAARCCTFRPMWRVCA